tara:strand:- start:18494 stop:22078 length:3585 start_codon:yes stop_codon:yes gene_type:complete
LGLLLFSGLYKLYYQDRNWAVNHQVNHFQESLNEVDEQLFYELDHYKSIIDTSGLEILLKNDVNYHKKLERKGVGIYIYSGDNLKFWSTNKFIIPKHQAKSGLSKLKNGYYLQEVIKEGEVTLIAQFFIKKSFGFENSYVRNSFDQKLYLEGGWDIQLYGMEGGYEIVLNSNKDTLFIKPNGFFQAPHNVTLMVLEVIGLFLFFTGCILLVRGLNFLSKIVFLFCLLVFGRIILWFFDAPINLHGLEIFDSKLLAFSKLIPSLGDLLLYVIFSLVLTFSLFKHIRYSVNGLLKFKFTVVLICFTIVFLMTWGIVETIEGIVLYSEIPLDLSHILSVEYTSIIALFCIAGIIAVYVVVSWKLIELMHKMALKLSVVLISFLFLMVMVTIFGLFFGFSDSYEILWSIPVVFLLSYSYYRNQKTVSFSFAISLLFLFSLMVTQSLRSYTDEKLINDKKQLLTKLAKEKDLIAEYLFQSVQEAIREDNNVYDLLSDYSHTDQDIFEYFKKKYFQGFWNRFDLQVNPCFKGDSIVFLNESEPVPCEQFFSGIIESTGIEVSPGFYYLENQNGRISYLGVISFQKNAKVFIELDSKFKPDGVGFPTLLLDEQIERMSLNPDYSFAHFKHGELVKQKGPVLYSTKLSYYLVLKDGDWSYIERDQIGHLIKRVGDHVYFLSQPITSTWNQMAFYSYLFAFFSLLTVVSIVVYRFFYGKINEASSFKTRFQSVIIFILFFSTVFIGVGSVYYLKNQYNQKNFDAISEKIKSVKIEVEQKLGGDASIEKTDKEFAQLILEKFSKVFFTDINLFDPNGKLVVSSQHKMFEEGLVGERMNPMAMYQMLFNAQSQFVQIEEIEGIQFLSAYVPFYNNDGDLMAYLNLPYFARSNDLKNEISNFIVALLNIYVLLIVLALVIGLILTNKITEPLRLIQEKMANIKLGKSNELINYTGKDEVGKLVNEYNRMIIELTESAKRLAESEREDAWREMAKQVAHEIKNPLTPMKLSIQHLQMRWALFDEKERQERFDNFAKNLIQQIDTLSAIAGEFSSFAKLGETEFREIDLTEIIKSAVDVYNWTNGVRVIFDSELDDLIVHGDKDQMLRVFNNLIKNAIQAIPDHKDGLVKVLTKSENELLKIIVEDNGKGISKDNYNRIFVPNFTTKNSGMGLGLAMVQKIIENMGGSIYFESEENEGTRFIIELKIK